MSPEQSLSRPLRLSLSICYLLAIVFAFDSTHERANLISDFEGVLCENRVSAFFVVDYAGLRADASLVYNDVSEKECLQICGKNRDSVGRFILCSSVTYDHSSFECRIHRSKSRPEGTAEYTEHQTQRYFEKFCLDERLPVKCGDSLFYRADQYIIKGFAKNVSLVRSLVECTTQCALERFPCKSAMYFYEDGECITNTESALTEPHSTSFQQKEKVIYFENSCLEQIKEENLADVETENLINDNEQQSENIKLKKGAIKSIEKTKTIVHRKGVGKTEPIIRAASKGFSHESEEGILREKATSSSVLGEENNVGRHDVDSMKFEDYKSQDGKELLNEVRNDESQKYAEIITDIQDVSFEGSKYSNSDKKQDKVRVMPHAHGVVLKPLKPANLSPPDQPKDIASDDDYFSQWSSWSPCIKVGVKTIRRRKCYDLRNCLGSLMEIGTCTKEMVKITKESENQPSNSATTFVLLNSNKAPEANGKAPESIWSPWSRDCQSLAREQPCINHEMIGYKNRKCLATDQSICVGPHYRYCALPC